jgi:hypothetical protein
VGVAAHVHAAAQGGPRYNAAQTPEERCSIENGVALCVQCGTLIDKDDQEYTAELLREWKRKALESASKELGKPVAASPGQNATLAHLAGLASGTVVRLVYRLEGSSHVHERFQIKVLGVDMNANVLRFETVSGNPGPADAMPLDDIEQTWVAADGMTCLRLSGFMRFEALQPHRYVSRPSSVK